MQRFTIPTSYLFTLVTALCVCASPAKAGHSEGNSSNHESKRHRKGKKCEEKQEKSHSFPSAISFAGDCDLPGPCHVERQGDQLVATCTPSFRGGVPRFFASPVRGGGFEFKSEDGNISCKVGPKRGSMLKGECEKTIKPAEGETGETKVERCNVRVETKLKPVAYAAKLPAKIQGLQFCGKKYGDCTVAQSGVDLNLKCGEGEDVQYLNASLTGDTFQHWYRRGEDWFGCKGEWDGSSLKGACTQWVGFTGEKEPEVCDDLAFVAESENEHGSCPQILPEQGFTMDGCDMDGVCVAVQRGCVWQISCGGEQVYSGRLSRNHRLKFKDSAGNHCSALVGHDGRIYGSCKNKKRPRRSCRNKCYFRSVAPQTSENTFQMPERITTRGCGAFFEDCQVYQDGNEFMATCESGYRNFYGVVDSNSVQFTGLGGYECVADLVEQDGKQRLLGACTRQNADGTVSECADLSEAFGARLALDWEQ